MNNIDEQIVTIYGNKIRLRACGVLIHENAILLMRHDGLGKNGYLWAPPGGGLQFGESIHTCIKREFLEECFLDVDVQRFLTINEHLEKPLHAIELFYKVNSTNIEKLKLGNDPETPNMKVLSAYDFFSKDKILQESSKVFHESLYTEEIMSLF